MPLSILNINNKDKTKLYNLFLCYIKSTTLTYYVKFSYSSNQLQSPIYPEYKTTKVFSLQKSDTLKFLMEYKTTKVFFFSPNRITHILYHIEMFFLSNSLPTITF